MALCQEGRILLGLSRLNSKIQKKIGGALSVHGISFTEYLVLSELHAAPENKIRRVDLAEKVGLSASGVTRLVNPMEKIGLVEKQDNARDARVSFVVLANAGRRIYGEVTVAFEHSAKGLLSPLNGEDKTRLTSTVNALL